MDWPKITVDTPLEEVNAIHKRIWDYVITCGVKPDTPYIADCAFCEYAIQLKFKERTEGTASHSHCYFCPSKTLRCNNNDSIFGKWSYSIDPHKRRRLAIQIHDILDTEKEE